MADNFPYVHSSNTIPRLFERIKTVSKPSTVDTNWLKLVGFKSGNDGRLLSVLSYLGFTDPSKNPTDLWLKYSGANGKQVMAQAIRNAYVPFYSTYENAHDHSNEDLSNIVRTKTGLGVETVRRIVSTYRALVALADFSGSNVAFQDQDPKNSLNPASAEDSLPDASNIGALTINLNVQLTLPESTDPNVYDAFFKSMREHLLNHG
jgi:hypothetical protein